MAYHGYIPHIKTFLAQIPEPRILEVGLDKGITTIPLIAHLARSHTKSLYFGIDIHLQEALKLTLGFLTLAEKQTVQIYEGNSLEALPKLAAEGIQFDLILLDGDHNYYTVIRELGYLDTLTHSGSVVIVDDYHGRWAQRDLWYSEREGWGGVRATPRQETELQGVGTAVDAWIAENPHWELSTPLAQGEPAVLKRRPGPPSPQLSQPAG